MQIFVTGATGFIGHALIKKLLADGHSVSAWVRSTARAAEALGPRVDLVDARGGAAAMDPAVAAADAIVNLAGERVVGKRWTEATKKQLWASRIDTTQAITAAIARAPRPRAFVSGSAIGYYGDTGDTQVDEDSPPGTGFLAELCVAWEQAAQAAEAYQARVTRIRTGLVLGKGGGVLGPMLPLFRMGLGGRLGDGEQWMAWIHLADMLGILMAAIEDANYSGPINAVAPGIVTNLAFTKALGRALHRPTILPAPAFALKLALGESASALLGGQRAAPKRALALGYEFKFPAIDAALADVLG
jgi:uncharacterized protein (TIGR01777 family)